jgi:Holliday junction resolvase RusA-like endonuclease
MDDVLNFRFLGVPMAKQSFKFANKTDKFGNAYMAKYTPSAIVNDDKTIASQVISQIPISHKPWTGAIMVRVQYVFPVTSNFSKKKLDELRAGKRFFKTTKPDLDNLDKKLKDAMEGRVYLNDAQICSSLSEKIYGEVPRVEISLKHLGC